MKQGYKFVIGDKVYLWRVLALTGNMDYGVISERQASYFFPNRWIARIGNTHVQWEDDLSLVSDLTELERLYYGV